MTFHCDLMSGVVGKAFVTYICIAKHDTRHQALQAGKEYDTHRTVEDVFFGFFGREADVGGHA
jgi:hypothetical protein